MKEHLFQHDLTGVLHTQSHHGQTVANKDHVHAGVISHVPTGKVVGSHDSDGLTLAVEGAKGTNGDLLAGIDGSRPHGGMGATADLVLLAGDVGWAGDM